MIHGRLATTYAKPSRLPHVRVSLTTLSLTIREESAPNSWTIVFKALYRSLASLWLYISADLHSTYNRSTTMIPSIWSILPLIRPSRIRDTTKLSTSVEDKPRVSAKKSSFILV